MSGLGDWTRRLVSEDAGLRALGAASFLESTIVPIPLETLVAPLMAAHPRRAYSVATAILIGCLIGALLFYLLASWLFDPVVAPALAWLGLDESFAEARAHLEGRSFFWAVFLVSVTPLPFQLATLGAGAVGGNAAIFMAAVASSRAIRYFGLAVLARLFGERALRLAGSRTRLVIGGALLLVGLYLIANIVGGALGG